MTAPVRASRADVAPSRGTRATHRSIAEWAPAATLPTPTTEAEWTERIAMFQSGPLPPRRDAIAAVIARLRHRFPLLERRRLTYTALERLMREQGILVFRKSWFRAGMVLGTSFDMGKPFGYVDMSQVIVATQVTRPGDRLVVLAHEWGHLILHTHDPRPAPAASERDLDYLREAEANLFAAELLRWSLDEIHRCSARAIMETNLARDRRRIRSASISRHVRETLRRVRECPAGAA